MLEQLAGLFGAHDVDRLLTLGALVAARVAPLTVFAPWLTLRQTPPLIRSALVVALTVSLAPATLASADALARSPSGLELGAWMVREALIGTLFAVVSSLPFFALDWAGRLIDTWRGASLAEVIAPPTGERTSPLGDLYLMLGVALFVTLGGHRVALEAFAEGLRVAPVGAAYFSDPSAIALGAASLSGAALGFATSLAAPAAASIVLVELALGLLARSAPQIPVFFAGMPLRAAAGLGASLVGLSLVVGQLRGAYGDALASAKRWLEALHP